MFCKPIRLSCAVTRSIPSTHCKFNAVNYRIILMVFIFQCVLSLLCWKSHSSYHLRVTIHLSIHLLPVLRNYFVVLWLKLGSSHKPGKCSTFTWTTNLHLKCTIQCHNCIHSLCNHKHYQIRSGMFKTSPLSYSKYFAPPHDRNSIHYITIFQFFLCGPRSFSSLSCMDFLVVAIS